MERQQEPVLLQSCDKILERIENSNLSDVEKNKIKKGEMSPFIIYGLDFDNDTRTTIFRHSYFKNKNGFEYKQNPHGSLFPISIYDADLDYLLKTSYNTISHSLNNPSHNDKHIIRDLYSFSKSASVPLFKYGYFPYDKINPKNNKNNTETFFFGETNVNSLYLKVILRDNTQENIIIPLREIAAKEYVWKYIKSQFGSNIRYSDILCIKIEDINYDISNIRIDKLQQINKDRNKGLTFVAASNKDLEVLSTFVPEDFSIIYSYNIIQIIKLYLLSLVCYADDKYTNALYNLLNIISMKNNYPHSIKLARNSQTCMAIKNFLCYLNNKNIIAFESSMSVFHENKILGYPDKYNYETYLDYIKYLNSTNTVLSEDEWFDVKMVSWVLNQI